MTKPELSDFYLFRFEAPWEVARTLKPLQAIAVRVGGGYHEGVVMSIETSAGGSAVVGIQVPLEVTATVLVEQQMPNGGAGSVPTTLRTTRRPVTTGSFANLFG